MATQDLKISQLNEVVTVEDRAMIPIVQGGVNKRVSVDNLLKDKADKFTVDGDLQMSEGGVISMTDMAKKRLFIDLWNNACLYYRYGLLYGMYNSNTDKFELNGLTDITYGEALGIYNFGKHSTFIDLFCGKTDSIRSHNSIPVRTTLPSLTHDITIDSNVSNPWIINGLKVISLGVVGHTEARPRPYIYLKGNLFLRSQHLTAILDPLVPLDGCTVIGDMYSKQYPSKIETIYIREVNHNLNIKAFNLLSLESIDYLIDNATNTSEITITVHPDVYANLTDVFDVRWAMVLEAAAAKNIAFAPAE